MENDNQNMPLPSLPSAQQDQLPPVLNLAKTRTPSEILQELLRDTGIVSTTKLKSKLRENGITEVEAVVEELNSDSALWKKVDRSFCTHEKFVELEESEPAPGESEIDEDNEDDETFEKASTRETRRRSEEKRLCEGYVLPFLKSLYHSAAKPKEFENIFVVQDLRPSSDLRNVDIIAVNWRTEEIAELATIEVKLSFCSQLLQQAANYRRFSHRVWVAVKVQSGIEVEEIAASLIEKDALLFDQILHLGLGIIACQKGRGNSYNCYPIQWPQKQVPDEFEKLTFMQDYRETFEQAGLLEKRRRTIRVA
jgi:hypothetical protein